MKHLFRTKSHAEILADADGGEHRLERALGPWHLAMLGVGCIIGAGIFVLTGNAAAQYAGPAIALSFVLSGLGCIFAGLCYAEFASVIPLSGSAYTYSYATLGEFFAWVIGWDLILEYLFGASTVAVGWSGYVVSFLGDFGIHLPPQLTAPTGTAFVEVTQAAGPVPAGWHQLTPTLETALAKAGVVVSNLNHLHAVANVPAMLIVAVATWLLVVGIRESASVNAIIVFVKVAVILLFIGFGAHYVHTANWHPFIPEATPDHFGEFGWGGILRGAGVVFFAYIGFDVVSTTAQEAKNPQRDLPFGILVSLIVCIVLYVAVSLVMTGLVSYKELNVPHPIAVAVDAAGPALNWLRPVVKFGAIAGLSSVVLVLMMGQTRVLFSMGRDRLLPEVFARIHPRYKTPWITTLITGILAMLVAGAFPIGVLGELVSIGALLAFTMVCAGVMVMRTTRPDLPRPFRTPWVPFVPLAGMGFSLLQMLGLPPDTWLRLVVWMFLGIIVYITYSQHHSRQAKAANPPS